MIFLNFCRYVLRLLPWLVCGLLAACASGMRVPERLDAQPVHSFQIEARFSVRLLGEIQPPEIGQGGSGRLLWRHAPAADTLIFSTPLGQILAELRRTAAGASLRLASGEERRAKDVGALLQGVLAYPLPVNELPDWLLGRPAPSGHLQADAQGRPQQLIENGWVIEYAYDDAASSTLPSRLVVRREGELELRLRIEEWQINTP